MSREPDYVTKEEYLAAFADPAPLQGEQTETHTKATEAYKLALETRKFEIDLYWKRATYFWTFIAAAFAAYALTYKTANENEPWLSVVFSALGFIFSFAWYLVNRGSKLWQNNWESHVDLLEDIALGPLYKFVVENKGEHFLTGAGRYSVTKINQLLSIFVTCVWGLLLLKSTVPIPPDFNIDLFSPLVGIVTLLGFAFLAYFGRSKFTDKTVTILNRRITVEKPLTRKTTATDASGSPE